LINFARNAIVLNERRLTGYYPILIAAASALLFIPFIGRLHLFDWDEINFAECAREMIVSHDYLNVQINFQPFWEKPPLFIWMQVLSMKAFGINEFAARLPDAICGIVTLQVVYAIGKRMYDAKFGLWWVLVYASSVLSHLYFRSGIIDPWFNLFIFLSVYFFILYSDPSGTSTQKRITQVLLSGVFAGLAILTKGPVGVLLVGLVIIVYYVIFLFRQIRLKSNDRVSIIWPKLSEILIFLIAVLLVGGSWFIIQWLSGNSAMVMKFIQYQVRLFTIPDAGHGGHWSYHFWVLLFGMFPASILALRSFRIKSFENRKQHHFYRLMLILFWVVLILFSVVKTKIVHYSSLCYFPLTFLAALSVRNLVDSKQKLHWGYKAMLIFTAAVFMIITLAVPLADHYKQAIIDSGMIKDDFAVANLGANVLWAGYEWIVGVILLAGTILSVGLFRKNREKSLAALFATSLVFVWLTILLYPYKIEQYTQRAAIDFFKSKANEKCYILNAGYFTYAPAFYANRMPDDYRRPIWLLTGDIDRPLYLILKEPHYEQWKRLVAHMKVVEKKNGWVVLERLPSQLNKE